MKIIDFFTDMRVVQIERLAHPEEGTTYYMHLESMTSDLLACRIAIPAEAFEKLEDRSDWPEVEDILPEEDQRKPDEPLN